MSTLFLCGAGNSEGVRLALAVNAERRAWDRLVLLDDDPAKGGLELLGVPVAGSLTLLADADPTHDHVVNLVARTCDRRAAMEMKIAAFGLRFASLVHPSVETSGTTLEEGATVYSRATVGPEVRVGSGSIVFMGAVVGHETTVGHGCVIAANAVLNARVRLEDRVYVGSNATIVPEVTIGAGATIGVGSAVLTDVPAGATALGVPAEILRAAQPAARPTATFHLEQHATDSASRRELSARVARVWQATLHLDQVGPDQNFFDLGGTSLVACHLADALRDATGHPVCLVDIFRFPTVSALVGHLAAGTATADPMSAAAERAERRRQLQRVR